LNRDYPKTYFEFCQVDGLASLANRFITNSDVRKIVFTGSTEVGKQIMRGAADQIQAGGT
jgi:betaine-aldehyde dehydrogenase